LNFVLAATPSDYAVVVESLLTYCAPPVAGTAFHRARGPLIAIGLTVFPRLTLLTTY